MPIDAHTPIPDILYGTAWKEDRTKSLTELAIQSGFRAIDTANQRKHYFEAAVGEALAASYAAGVVTRADLFLQTKFTYQRGQDNRLPYDPTAALSTQVVQSMASSLDHLGTDHVDSYVLHGPANNQNWSASDSEVWSAMTKEREAGRARFLGVSNISIDQLNEMEAAHALPDFIQNRCFAHFGWDREVRRFCAARKIIYQGFSLLTANAQVLHHPFITEIAEAVHATPAQIIFAFARGVGMLPLTGTSDSSHMLQDLAALELVLPHDALVAIDSIAG